MKAIAETILPSLPPPALLHQLFLLILLSIDED